MARTLAIITSAILMGLFIPRQSPAQDAKIAYLSSSDVKAVITKYRTSDAKLQVQAWALHMPAPIVKNVVFRKKIMSGLPSDLLKLRVDDDELVKAVRQVLRPVLGLYGRDQVYEIVIVKHHLPVLMSDSGVALVVSTGMLQQAVSDDVLLGGVAHEVAHEYFVKRSYNTKQRYRLLATSSESTVLVWRSLVELSRIELECDAFATVTLAAIGRNPAEFANYIIATVKQYGESSESYHPQDLQRKEVIEGVVSNAALQIKPQPTESFKRMKELLSKL